MATTMQTAPQFLKCKKCNINMMLNAPIKQSGDCSIYIHVCVMCEKSIIELVFDLK